jgi:hypothetical protein
MGMSLWGLSPLCETGILKEISIPNENSDWQSARRGNCVGAIQGGELGEQLLLSLKTLWAALARLR